MKSKSIWLSFFLGIFCLNYSRNYYLPNFTEIIQRFKPNHFLEKNEKYSKYYLKQAAENGHEHATKLIKQTNLWLEQ